MKSMLATADLLKKREAQVLETWEKSVRASAGRTFELMTADEFDEQTRSFVAELSTAISSGNYEDITQPEYGSLLRLLEEVSASRAERGFTPKETAVFIMSFKEAINTYLQEEIKDPKKMHAEAMIMGNLIDKLALQTIETFVASREKMLKEQAEALEFSNPMITVWDNLIAFPLQGILDTDRMGKFTIDMLNAIVDHEARVVIVDLTAIPAMDTATCNRLIQAIEAARLMGAEAIITGISASVAAIIVQLGVDLKATTLRELREGIEYAFKVLNLKVTKEVS